MCNQKQKNKNASDDLIVEIKLKIKRGLLCVIKNKKMKTSPPPKQRHPLKEAAVVPIQKRSLPLPAQVKRAIAVHLLKSHLNLRKNPAVAAELGKPPLFKSALNFE